MQVRITEPRNQATGPALPAGLELSALAGDQLRQPECKALLAHPGRAGDEQYLGQAPAPGRGGEASAGLLVSDYVGQ
jgi:hypothetical protein